MKKTALSLQRKYNLKLIFNKYLHLELQLLGKSGKNYDWKNC